MSRAELLRMRRKSYWWLFGSVAGMAIFSIGGSLLLPSAWGGWTGPLGAFILVIFMFVSMGSYLAVLASYEVERRDHPSDTG